MEHQCAKTCGKCGNEEEDGDKGEDSGEEENNGGGETKGIVKDRGGSLEELPEEEVDVSKEQQTVQIRGKPKNKNGKINNKIKEKLREIFGGFLCNQQF